jgi:hypothetical protein
MALYGLIIIVTARALLDKHNYNTIMIMQLIPVNDTELQPVLTEMPIELDQLRLYSVMWYTHGGIGDIVKWLWN